MESVRDVASGVTTAIAGAAGAVVGTYQAATSGNQPSTPPPSSNMDTMSGDDMGDDTGSDMEQ
jgi:hypothetical protein